MILLNPKFDTIWRCRRNTTGPLYSWMYLSYVILYLIKFHKSKKWSRKTPPPKNQLKMFSFLQAAEFVRAAFARQGLIPGSSFCLQQQQNRDLNPSPVTGSGLHSWGRFNNFVKSVGVFKRFEMWSKLPWPKFIFWVWLRKKNDFIIFLLMN